jgi:hypothetical protein
VSADIATPNTTNSSGFTRSNNAEKKRRLGRLSNNEPRTNTGVVALKTKVHHDNR